ncbi:hypothetical protein CC117_32785 [Parafrankia colletiae]|uniref:non-specific serine/threonine protein kinase n=1 Tax=Parafrankia colletiae TaxID=573497 RepID=A0A1S1RB14_9ACTN|nr:protein kinase [Parafrankia colletiae]MCK9905061.1 protein kinase [Frankia sp. Cpl3]OHV42971.1 hypothetical protein CC117_32785 [Parafrankia colletiae]
MIVDRERVQKALPGYHVAGRLGAGSFGLVLAGEHRRMGRPVAIKVMDAEGSEDVANGFAAEARVLAGLDHPHVLRAHDYVEAEGLCLVVMELLDGGTLTSRQADMGPEQACAVGLAVAAALEHAHGHGVLHRDIKPDNILFALDGTPKVSDFGLSKVFEGSAATASGMAGTPLYMAPEQFQHGRLGPSTDLYALGVVLYRLLAGRPPFDAKQPVQALWYQHLAEAPPPMVGVEPTLAAVVLRALAKDPSDRHQDAAAFALDLAQAATQAFGPGWAVRAGLPLHLSDAVRRAAVDPVPRPVTVGGTTTAVSSDEPATLPGWDFFISYARADHPWAEWIAGQLTAAGYRVLLQAWADLPVSYWTAGMLEGIRCATRSLVIVSPVSLEPAFGRTEWNSVRDADPLGLPRQLIPVRVEDCPCPDPLDDSVRIDLFGQAADTARRSLLEQVNATQDERTESLTAPFSAIGPPPVDASTIESLVPPQRSPASDTPEFPPAAAAVGRKGGGGGRRRRSAAAGPQRRAARLASVCAVVVAVLAIPLGLFDFGIPFVGKPAAPKAEAGPAENARSRSAVTTPASGPEQSSVAPTTPAPVDTPAPSASSAGPQSPAPSSVGPQVPASSGVTPPAASTTTRSPSGPAQAGPAGPSSDPKYSAGSEISVSGCAGWLSFSGVLYGTLSAGAASCAAEVTTIDLAYGADPASAGIAASNYSTKNSRPAIAGGFGYYRYSVQICIWNESARGNRKCSPKYVDTQGSVAPG